MWSARLFPVLWSLPALAYAAEDLASTLLDTGIKVVFVYETASNCVPTACAYDTALHSETTLHGSEDHTVTYPTVIPQICPTGWENVTYAITETLTRGIKPTANHGKPPPGFTVTTTKCHVCGPTPTVVAVTIPYRSKPPPKLTKSVISCTGGGHDTPGLPFVTASAASRSSISTLVGTGSADILSDSTLLSNPSSSATSKTSLASEESSILSDPTWLPGPSTFLESTISPTETESYNHVSPTGSSNLTSSLQSSGSTPPIMSSNATSTPVSIELPVQTATCEPKFYLSGVSEHSFNKALIPFTLDLSCGGLDVDNYTVLANWVPVVGTTSTTKSITLDSLNDYALLTVVAFEASGWPIFQTFPLLFGSSSLTVQVTDGAGNLVPGARVYANASTYLNVGEVLLTDADGKVVFENVPSTTISLRAVGPDQSLGVDSIAGGLVTSITITLEPFHEPVEGNDDFDVDNGLSGWTGGTVVDLATKRAVHLVKRASSLVIYTNGQPDVQMARKTFTLADDASSVFIEYQFQTDEVPGGYFGSQFNDYFSVSIQTDDGGSAFISRSMNELGLGAFIFETGETDWFTAQLDVSNDANSVEFIVAVSNVADSAYQSKVTVRRVGVCDKCASCTDCPELAKCQDSCKTPALNSCAFYSSCAEETLKCGASGYPLGRGERTCNKLQHLMDKFSDEGKQLVTRGEQCMEQALVDYLTCEASCEAIEGVGLNSLPKCYADNGFCSVKGMDYVYLLSILDDNVYKTKLKEAALSQVDCVEHIFDAIDLDIKEKIADAAEGNNVVQNVADVLGLVGARVFFAHVPKGKYLDRDEAIKHVKQVYDTAVTLGQGNANERVMDYYRYPDYNDWKWWYFVGVVNPVWIEIARQHGVVPYVGFRDPASPQINVGFSHLFASMIGVYFHGERSTKSDITGWLGDLYQLYGDWSLSGTESPGQFCVSHFGTTLPGGFKMEDLRQDADAFNIGRALRRGLTPNVAAGFKTVMEGGYAHRFRDFFQNRFDGSIKIAKDACTHYMTTVTDIEAVAARKAFAGYVFPPGFIFPDDKFMTGQVNWRPGIGLPLVVFTTPKYLL
ncbi:hypothetical protein B0J13DRAFT_636427 [Dactylonectria estremocensis]|uniref:Uncharacterized protein n=1 Tax=Dactylonectria estremocensis TaxID=1079267 RepID=A0A9P9ESK6_9HYPO|nr:hypothetical protein B0J13DRAFT_636427 [Dactylonectria estremocensis]